jgi:Spy/CpxP family protein refolding chaperone
MIAELETAEQELDGLLKQTPLDLVKVEATLRKIEGIRVSLRLGRIKAIEQGRSLLSPDQQNRLETLLGQGGMRPSRRRG